MKILHVFTLIRTAGFFDGQFKYLSETGKFDLHLATTSKIDKEFCKRNNLSYSRINIERRISPIEDLKSIYNLYKLIRKEKYNAVFGHTPKGAMVAMIAAKLAGVKNRIYYRHGFIYTTATGLKYKILKTVERVTSLLASKIINVSPSLGERAIKDKINKENKQIVIGKGTCGGIDTLNTFNPDLIKEDEIARLRNLIRISQNNLVIGFCGRICIEKGVRELIEGFNIFKRRHPEIKPLLLILGAYDTRDILPENYKEIIHNSPDIIAPGKILKEELPKYYSLMNVITLPSYREGFGMCVIEAGAMKVPALVSRSHGCVDSIIENETGIYIDISPEGIAKGLENILDPAKRNRMGNNSRENVLKNYDHSVLWPKILDFYDSLQEK